MSVILAIAVGVAMGVVFGFALEKSRVFEPAVIVGQMQMRNFIMLKMFLSAVATGLLGLSLLQGFGLVTLHPKATLYGADVIGGLLLGCGISLAGACPGTVLAQLGVGYKDAWATLAGGFVGAITFGYLQPALQPLLLSGGPGTLTLNGQAGLPFAAVAVPFAGILVAFLFWLEKVRPWVHELGENNSGLLEK